ncbi:MAG: hypothetical protein RL556_808 [Actinomycetota bacterium]
MPNHELTEPKQLPHFHLIDGGLSTELERIGSKIEGNLWTGHALLDQPQIVEQAHRNYAEAGAQVVISSSYQVSRQGFQEIGLGASDADRALAESIHIARRGVAGTNAKVAASVGPYGAVLHDGSEYRGVYEVGQNFLEDFHSERLAVLLAANPDYLAVETIPNVVEARALANVLRENNTPRWVSFTAGSGDRLWSGEFIQAAVEEVAELQNLVAVGINCVDPSLVSELARNIKSVTGAAVIAYPNGGGEWDSAAGVWIGQEPRSLSSWLPEWLDAGVEWVGGCCGTSALDIKSLSQTRL